ncbi:type 2 periplasmic-binding domain-containing protein [Cucumibacter marinus]|uniref:hypothetical protein n=1 Tax=Cucumibacter marinus TaxID=1121252 RepID=UPI000413B675|nr:hypothetical protein [Cucumibacter marinus]
MTEPVVLRGMTWDHSRGYDPMVATAEAFCASRPGVSIVWEKRSLQAFADRPIGEMADTYDLMVIDHPHVGEVAGSGDLLAFDTLGRDDELRALSRQSVGPSHCSYEFLGHQWALAIDAATPVAAYRPDLIDLPPTAWQDVIDLAGKGRVAMALIPINALMTFFGLAANQDFVIAEDPDHLIDGEAGITVLEQMLALVSRIDARCLTLDPIGIYEWMSTEADAPAYSPFGYGYTNYSRKGYRPHPIVFTDAPGIRPGDPTGTVIGGAGIAVSSRSAHRDIAADYAFYVASAECQSGLYFEAGGQPGNVAAWDSAVCNADCMNFFFNTRKTLESSWLRPRYDGYMALQDRGGDIIHACLKGEVSAAAALEALDAAYRETRK